MKTIQIKSIYKQDPYIGECQRSETNLLQKQHNNN